MPMTNELARRLVMAMLESTRRMAEEEEISGLGKTDHLRFTRHPIEAIDGETSEKFYGLVHVFVSAEKQMVTQVAEAVEQIQIVIRE